MKLKNLRLGEEVNKHFVKGLMTGYNKYLQVRVDAAKELEVSSGYAYTRGNHLEDSIAKESTTGNITFQHAKAGSWAYLQFKVEKSDEEYLVIVRRSERIEETQKELNKKNLEERKRNWLYNLAENNKDLKLSESNKLHREAESKQVKLFADTRKEEKAIIEQTQLDINLDEKYSRFYILSYEINPSTYVIDDASLSMLDSHTLELVEIESLRPLVIEYESIINKDLVDSANEIMGPEELAGEATEYVVHIPQEETAGGFEEYPMEESESESKAQENE